MTRHRCRPVAVLTECTAHPWGRWHPKPLNQPGSQHIQVHANARFHFFVEHASFPKIMENSKGVKVFGPVNPFSARDGSTQELSQQVIGDALRSQMILLTIPTKNPKCGKTCKNMIKNRQVCSIQSKLLEFTSHSMSFMTLGVLTTSLHCNQDTQTWLSSLSFLALQSSMQLQNVETNNNPTQETPRYV